MQRYYFACDDRESIQFAIKELRQSGFDRSQLHIVSNNENRDFMESFMPATGSFYSTLLFGSHFLWFAIFTAIAIAILAFSFGFKLFTLFWCMAIPVIGFSLLNRQTDSSLLEQLSVNIDSDFIHQKLDDGSFILLIEMQHVQKESLDYVLNRHPELKWGGFHEYIYRP
ncbi:hypothetical protein [Thalassotalea sp. Y01]|uniref:hypothetical protein n=1 Tax=Thalassotalea sp. Y01 TaxID=2729613 RepID=UPI00145D72BB|nr:hypothetical protein [Thalassotalea sp. Y01]NMP16440.1 hypothetical protein [Thalassotalea sp. Y01]